MLQFTPKHILSVKEQISTLFPLPEDYATRDNSQAVRVLDVLRLSGIDSFKTISDSELNWIYHLSLLCDEQEFQALKSVYMRRVTQYSYTVGWMFYQLHPNEQRVKEIFTIACNWMNANKPEEYSKTLPYRTGLPLDDIYIRAIDIIKAEKRPFREFAEKHRIMFDSIFSNQLLLVYLSRCDKTEITKYEKLLIKLMDNSAIEFLRPALQNVTYKLKFEEMSPTVVDAIILRLTNSKEENIGISPQMLQRMKKIRYSGILEEFYPPDSQKKNIFGKLSYYIKEIERLTDDCIAIDLGTYCVVDAKNWQDYCFALQPATYAERRNSFLEQDRDESVWLNMEKERVPTAHDVILDLAHSSVIMLEFSSFNMLFSRDLLLSGRLLRDDG
ncbi:MAG: hypothetical protein BGN88_05320 [Clostridiales bacterium 43-6]|nr:MAG: hypothetical protein BGN88_05320 [Clostridiales bacterium 43-6]